MYDQEKLQNAKHRYFFDYNTGEMICICPKCQGKQKGERRNKFNARKTPFGDRVYDSGAEAVEARNLELRRRAGQIKSWEPQYPVEIRINGEHILTTKVDFLVHHNDGTKELREVKSAITERQRDYRIIRRLIEVVFLPEHPEWSYTVVK